MQLATSPSSQDVVLDFFAGSGVTAHAVLAQNGEDGGNRRFICVQLPERLPIPEASLRTIADIARHRLVGAGKLIAAEYAGKLDLDQRTEPLDLGFRAYQLTTSNFTPWDGDPARFGAPVRQPGLFPTTVAEQLELAVDNVLPGRTSEDILAELLLKSGFELTAPVERLTLAGKDLFSVAEGALLVCLERELTLDVIEAMVSRDPAQIICLDAGFNGNDQLKVNAVQTIRTRSGSGDTKIEFKVV